MVEWGQLGFRNVVTATGRYLVTYYDIVIGVVVVITVVVGGVILAYFSPLVNGKRRYRYGRECAWLEILWTVSPAGVLIFLSFFSLTNLYSIEIGETIDYQRKITAHQWYWEYEYFLPKRLFESTFMRWNFDLSDRVGNQWFVRKERENYEAENLGGEVRKEGENYEAENLGGEVRSSFLTKNWKSAHGIGPILSSRSIKAALVFIHHTRFLMDDTEILESTTVSVNESYDWEIRGDCSFPEVFGESQKWVEFLKAYGNGKSPTSSVDLWFQMGEKGEEDHSKVLSSLYGYEGFKVGRMNVDSYLDYKLEKDNDDKLAEKIYDTYCSKQADYEIIKEKSRGRRVGASLKGSSDVKAKYNFSRFNTLLEERLNLFTSRIGLSDQMFVLPSSKTTVLSVVTSDVIHRWGVPALGVKIDAVPGRINSFPVMPIIPGFLQGQCYELCGVHHRAIPVNVFIFGSREEYEDYLVHLREYELWMK